MKLNEAQSNHVSLKLNLNLNIFSFMDVYQSSA